MYPYNHFECLKIKCPFVKYDTDVLEYHLYIAVQGIL